MAIGHAFLQAFLLCGLIYAFARHEGDYNFQKVAIVTAGMIAWEGILFMTLPENLLPFAVVPVALVLAWMLMKFCWLSLKKAILVTVLFGVGTLLIQVAWSALLGGNERATENAAKQVSDEISKQTEEGIKIAQSIVQGTPPKQPKKTDKKAKTDKDATGQEELVPRAAKSGKKAAAPKRGEVDWDAARKSIAITARMSGKDKAMIAVVNGHMVRVGDVIAVDYDDRTYRFRLTALDQEQAEWQALDVRDAAE
ncbi:MAG TPA: hypothetical protein VIH35_05185 [Kiritimatiellia bacterium]